MGYTAGTRKPASGLGPRTCEGCGAEFQPYRSRQIYCSRKCRNNGPKATATRRAYHERPEVKAKMRVYRRKGESPKGDEWVRALNLKNTLRRYGVTPEWYETKLAEQEGACAICGHVPPPGGIKSASRLHVDHDHESGAVRDLLCNRCNMGVGYFRDNPALLRLAAAYIERQS